MRKTSLSLTWTAGVALAVSGSAVHGDGPFHQECVQAPAAKVTVEVPPPEVTIQQAPGAHVRDRKFCLFRHKVGHHHQNNNAGFESRTTYATFLTPLQPTGFAIGTGFAGFGFNGFQATGFQTGGFQGAGFSSDFGALRAFQEAELRAAQIGANRAQQEAELRVSLTALERAKTSLSAHVGTSGNGGTTSASLAAIQATDAQLKLLDERVKMLEEKVDTLITIQQKALQRSGVMPKANGQ